MAGVLTLSLISLCGSTTAPFRYSSSCGCALRWVVIYFSGAAAPSGHSSFCEHALGGRGGRSGRAAPGRSGAPPWGGSTPRHFRYSKHALRGWKGARGGCSTCLVSTTPGRGGGPPGRLDTPPCSSPSQQATLPRGCSEASQFGCNKRTARPCVNMPRAAAVGAAGAPRVKRGRIHGQAAREGRTENTHTHTHMGTEYAYVM